jgi:hypothetical protein
LVLIHLNDSVSCCTVLMTKGIDSLVIEQVFKKWYQNERNISVWTDGLRISGLVILVAHTNQHTPAVTSCNGTLFLNVGKLVILSGQVSSVIKPFFVKKKEYEVHFFIMYGTTSGYHFHKTHSSLRFVPSNSWTTLVLCGCIWCSLVAPRAGVDADTLLCCPSRSIVCYVWLPCWGFSVLFLQL